MACARTAGSTAAVVHTILTTPSKKLTGQSITGEELLLARGMDDFAGYAVDASVWIRQHS